VVERALRLAKPAWALAPPVIDEDVEGVEPFDVVPPHRRHEHRIARLEIGYLRVLQCFGELGEGLKIGLVEIDHAYSAPGGRIVDGPEIEITELVRREDGETAAPHRAAGQIVREIVVRRDPRGGADPDAGQWRPLAQVDVVGFVKPVEKIVQVDRGEVDRGRMRAPFIVVEPLEDVRQLAACHAEVHLHVGVVE